MITPGRTALAALAALIVLAAPAVPPPAAGAATPRTSLTAIWNDVMCVSCREPLAVAQSPQAYAERDYIRTLIAQGYTKPQIVRALVAQYGPAVLGKPPAQGFNLTVYVLPPAILLIGLATLAIALPRWRRRARAVSSPTAPASPPLKPAENKRLNEELSRYAG